MLPPRPFYFYFFNSTFPISLFQPSGLFSPSSHLLFKVKFFDCLFFAVSATTNTGLATVDILSLSQGSWATLCVLALAGSSVLLSILPVVVRMHYLQGWVLVSVNAECAGKTMLLEGDCVGVAREATSIVCA